MVLCIFCNTSSDWMLLLQPQKKYFKRGDLAEQEKKEYEAKHNIKRIEDKLSTQFNFF